MTRTHVLVGFASLLAACTKSSNECPANSTGGPVTGPADTHCGATVVVVDPSMCSEPPDGGVPDAGPDAGIGPDAAPEPEFGATLFGSEGDDDDCKYHVKWSATPVCGNGDVTFSLTITAKADGSAVTGASPQIEALLDSVTPALDSGDPTELGGGKYTVGPVRFGKSGRWLVRFHLFEHCHDSEESPHGHAAFFVDVP